MKFPAWWWSSILANPKLALTSQSATMEKATSLGRRIKRGTKDRFESDVKTWSDISRWFEQLKLISGASDVQSRMLPAPKVSCWNQPNTRSKQKHSFKTFLCPPDPLRATLWCLPPARTTSSPRMAQMAAYAPPPSAKPWAAGRARAT